MKQFQALKAGLLSSLVNCLRFIRCGMWNKQPSSKTTLNVDRRLLLLCSLLAIYGLIELFRGFDGIDATVVSDTFLSKSWPHAGGRIRVRQFEWWGLKRVEYLVEPRFYVDEDDPDKTRQKRWMIVNSTGPTLDDSGRQRFPWPLFYVSDDLTYYAFGGRDMRWFNFRRVEIDTAQHATSNP